MNVVSDTIRRTQEKAPWLIPIILTACIGGITWVHGRILGLNERIVKVETVLPEMKDDLNSLDQKFEAYASEQRSINTEILVELRRNQ